MLKYISLFSGIGAFEKALFNIGVPYELINYCEIDKYASKAYSLIHHIPESRNLWDITKVDETTLPSDVDLITYGFPCQDISIAGKKQGFVSKDGKKTRSVISHNDKHPGHIADRGGMPLAPIKRLQRPESDNCAYENHSGGRFEPLR